MKRLFFFLLVILFAIQQIIVLPGCANIIPPQGGPRDTIPPQLIKASPADSTRNFKGTRIIFSFDEFIDLQSIQENLLVSPLPKSNPFVESKLNTVSVRIKDSLESNTTYSLNFGNAIKDYNEGNVIKGFTYVFSTGPYIDSLELHGKVILAETGKTDSTLTVLLHSSADDSAVVNEKPRYITKLDGNGNFASAVQLSGNTISVPIVIQYDPLSSINFYVFFIINFDLFKMKYLPIKRHVKIKRDASPYDAQYKDYFEKRERLKRKSSSVHWVHQRTQHLVGVR